MASQLSASEALNFARTLDSALREPREIEPLTKARPELSLEDAYAIQAAGIRLRQERGERIVGYKMGLTSKAKMEQMNLHSPIYGVLTDRMRVADRGVFRLEGKIHPKAEPEVAFILGRALRGKVTPAQAFEACSGVCAALEILDSRYVGFKYFSLPDVVADNCSASYFVVSDEVLSGAALDPSRLDLSNLEVRLEQDGRLVEKASSGAVLGNPVNSLVYLCELLAAQGLGLEPGNIVLTGAATTAAPLAPGPVFRSIVGNVGAASVAVAS